MRNTSLPTGMMGNPATCGREKRAATLDITTYAVNPWTSGTLRRIAYPGILELAHSMGKVMGVLPTTPKSKALWVYFQMYSPSKTKYLPKACCRPTWNSFRWPGSIAPRLQATPGGGVRVARNGMLHPMLAITRFSLNGVSMVRAYETRKTV